MFINITKWARRKTRIIFFLIYILLNILIIIFKILPWCVCSFCANSRSSAISRILSSSLFWSENSNMKFFLRA